LEAAHLNELITVEQDYWWHVAKRALVTELLMKYCPPPGMLIEGGLGAGGNLRHFQSVGYTVTGFDIIPEAISYSKTQGLEDVRVHDLTQPWPTEAKAASAVVLLDVIEHIDDSVAVLGNAVDALADDGRIIVTVPAMPWLSGPWDEMLGHKRRYSHHVLYEEATQVGLTIEWFSYWNMFGLPPASVVRVMEKLFNHQRTAEFPPVAKWINKTLIGCAAVERKIMKMTSLPAGVSIVGVLKK